MSKQDTVQEHYENHLAEFYPWMMGDFAEQQERQESFFREQGLTPESTGQALDLGAGHGVHSVSLARLGWKVLALDFSRVLLDELESNRGELEVETLEGDMRDLSLYRGRKPELILCCGDTIAHLQSQEEVWNFIQGVCGELQSGGKLLLSFRDQSGELKGDARFLPIRQDENRIFTCFLEYSPEFITVTDQVYVKEDGGWNQRVSSYKKTRVLNSELCEYLRENNLEIIYNETIAGMDSIIAAKP